MSLKKESQIKVSRTMLSNVTLGGNPTSTKYLTQTNNDSNNFDR